MGNCPSMSLPANLLREMRLRAFAVMTTRRYRQIVDRFEEMARASLGKPRTIPAICAALMIGQRTLARAVRAVRGTTPSRHLHGLALAEARTALQDPATRSVRQVAMRCGFRELGRFAADYRAAYGEYPSETLRRSSAERLDDDLCAACEARR
jgi:transcriptional regulator GlxA family with amidase domain